MRVLILRDVLDFSAAETADVLEITVSSANSALYRARTTLSQRYRGQKLERSTSSTADERIQWLLDHFVRAWENADVEGLVALLKEDAILAMPPSPSWYQGRDAIRAFAAATVFAHEGMFVGRRVGAGGSCPNECALLLPFINAEKRMSISVFMLDYRRQNNPDHQFHDRSTSSFGLPLRGNSNSYLKAPRTCHTCPASAQCSANVRAA
jgi:hypothetical protein